MHEPHLSSRQGRWRLGLMHSSENHQQEGLLGAEVKHSGQAAKSMQAHGPITMTDVMACLECCRLSCPILL